ncbi:MAG: endonuclease [Cryptosporangiaceae bacterium]|nr:endonuclease [Cryptosporangiaceae bacterium]
MPEGDTVWRAAHRLDQALAGRRLVVADLRHPRWATVGLTGWTVREVASRGKHLLLRATSDHGPPTTVHSHLGMDGAWWIYGPGQSWRGGQDHQIRAIFGTGELTAVAYRLKELTVVPTADEDTLVGHLGPDLLGPDWDPAEAVRRIAADPDRTIGEALLDQRNLAGIGNLYRAEVLFLRGISPWATVASCGDLRPVVELSARLLSANREKPDQSTTGSTRKDGRSWVYGRGGLPCRRCGTPIQAADLGPALTSRRVYWCPHCQPGPVPPTPRRAPTRPPRH